MAATRGGGLTGSPDAGAGPGALARLSHRLTPSEAVRSASSLHRAAHVDLGPDSHPFADLARLAALLAGQPLPAETDVSRPSSPGPAAVALEATRHGLEAVCEMRDIATLKPSDAPLVVLLAGGGSRLVIAFDQEEASAPFAVLATSSGETRVDVKDLAEVASGSVFRLRMRAPEAHALDAEIAAGPERVQAPKAAAGHAGDLSALLAQAMRERKPLIIQLVIASMIINLCGLALPLFSMAVFDRVIPHSAMETLFALGLGVCLALGLELTLRHVRLKLFDAVSQSAGLSLQGRLMGRLLFARSADIPRSPGGLMHPAQELDGLAAAAPQLIVAVLVDLPFFLLLMVLLASIAGPVAIAPLVGTVAMVGLHILCHRLARDGHGAQSAYMRRQMQTMLEGVSAHERIRLTGAGPRFLAKWERAADEAAFAQHEQRFWHGLAAQGSAVLVQVVIVAAVIIGVFRIDSAAMTVGALSAAILLVNRAMTPVSLLVGLIFRIMQGMKSAAPLAGLMTTPVESGSDRGTSGAGIAGRLDLTRVSFTYPGEAKPALKEISLSIHAGEKVGIIGKAGCGKSTLLKLISCLNEPDEGRIALDGRDIRQFGPAAVRRAISAMPQDSALVDGTLEENLTLGLGAMPRVELDHVAGVAGVDEIVARHPSGYSMDVGPGGQRLSGGERQCVSLARALMGKPVMLLLDEPTSALDNTLEAKVLGALKVELQGKGLIVATHRLQVLALVDRVIWIDAGRIVADGPKEDVFRKFGLVA